MRPTVYHKPSTRERHIVAPNYTYAFARWLKKTTGRTLCPLHRHIIDRLERARLTAAPLPSAPMPWQHRPYTPARIIISDPAPDYTHITDLLVHYIHWLRTVILPHRQTLILDRTTTAARALVTTLPTSPAPHVGAHPGAPAPTAAARRRHPATKASKMRINCSSITSEARHGENSASQTRASERSINFHRARTRHPFATSPTRLHAVGSGCRPAIHRGGTFDIILLLNADTYPISGPRSSHVGMHARASAVGHLDALDAALDTFLPMLQPHRESILIIHGTPYPRPSRRRTPRRLAPLPPRRDARSCIRRAQHVVPPHPTPFLHYLTASLDGDLGPFIPIDPESITPLQQPAQSIPRADWASEMRINCSSITSDSEAWRNPTSIGTRASERSINFPAPQTPPNIPLSFAVAAPAA
ncbi:MAG: hypothetical protein NC117_05275 [Pseudoflavonifractor sp.]|nr:hypothetical protein [Pseudoflavonifractor sp.]